MCNIYQVFYESGIKMRLPL